VKRKLVTLALAFAAFLAVVIGALVVTYAIWYWQSWDYIHAPRNPDEVRDAGAYVLMGMELFFGLPIGTLLGLIAASVVLLRQRNHGDIHRQKEVSR